MKANAQSANNEQRIIGTWILKARSLLQSYQVIKWVFSDDGTLIVTNSDGTHEHEFVVTDTMLACKSIDNINYAVYNMSISSDGKTLLLGSSGSPGLWFTKK